MMKRMLFLAALSSLSLAAACANDTAQPQTPQPGVLSLILDAPDDSTGGALITLSGASVDSVVPTGSLTYGTATTSSNGANTFLAGSLDAKATVATVYVPDVHRINEIQVVVTDAANGVTNDRRAAGTVAAHLSAVAP
jgi:opacity protein-like surface antigen